MTNTRTPDDQYIARELADLRGSVLHSIDRSNRARRRARAGIVSVGVLALAGGLTAGTLAISRANNWTIANTVVCYQDADLGSIYAQVGPSMSVDQDGRQVLQPAPDLLVACQTAWHQGTIGQPQPAPASWDPNTSDFPVPRLALCEGRNGVAAAFPNRDTAVSAAQLCDSLGLPVWPAG